MIIVTIVTTVALMVLANAFYVAAEFGSVSARKTRIAQLAGEGDRLAGRLLPIMENSHKLDQYVAACQVGITVSSLVLGAYGQNTIATVMAPLLLRLELANLTEAVAFSISATGVLVLLSIVQVVLGELVPKSITLQYPERIALLTVIPMQWSLAVFRPLIWLFNGSANLLTRLGGVTPGGEQSHIHSPEEIELLVSESHEGGLLDDESQQMLRNAFRLRELTARQVMVPRTRLVAAALDSTVNELIDKACAEGYSRIPLYQSSIDNIVGFVHIKDLLRLHLQEQPDPAGILRQVIYVPEGLPVAEVWTRMNNQHQYIAIVFDEYGGTAGLITFEDLIEEVFGELQDEFDEELPLIASDREGRIYLRGDLLVADVNEYLGLDLPETEADTLGGLVFSELGQLPAVGDELTVGTPGVTIRVEAVEARSVTEVSLQLPAPIPPDPASLSRIGEWEVGRHE
ncbi:MAG: hemolysin family protein [Chloroflexota bacterium]